MSRRAGVLAAWLVVGFAAGCSSAPSKPVVPPKDPGSGSEDTATLARLFSELADDILSSYERDEPLELGTGMIDPKIGAVRIGVGPADVYMTSEPGAAGARPDHPRRWPLELDRDTKAEARSKRLEIQIAADQTAAWIADELSWRITVCARSAVIPLRITALYAHDGDRWVPVFEHLSFGWTPTSSDAPEPSAIKTAVLSGDVRDELSGVLWRGLFRLPHDPLVAAQDPSALVLGPDAGDEWHGAQILQSQLPAGKLEDRRVGTVGRVPGEATVAYWVGNYIADIPARPGVAAGKVRMRGTYVFEKRRPAVRDGKAAAATSCAIDPVTKAAPADCRWMLVQSHLSQAITDKELTNQVFGTARLSLDPLVLDCSDGTSPTAPAAGLRPASTLPAAETP